MSSAKAGIFLLAIYASTGKEQDAAGDEVASGEGVVRGQPINARRAQPRPDLADGVQSALM